jgi:hypothetical protein
MEATPRVGDEAMTDNDAAAAEFYSNPENRKPVGPPRARAGQARLLTSHVPIRFRPQTIEKAKAIAERDGMTVSSWIRGVVEREVERRMPALPQTHLSESDTTWRIVNYTNPTPEVETENPRYDRGHAQLEPI